MARFDTSGMDDLISDIGGIANIPDAVMDGMLNAEADVVVSAQKRSISATWNGKYATRISTNAVSKGKVKKSKDGRGLSITFKGSRKRANTTTPNSEVAFVNEFGAPHKHIAPRPAIKSANDQSVDLATKAAAEVLDRFYKSKNL